MQILDNGVTVTPTGSDQTLKGDELKQAQENALAKGQGKEVAPKEDPTKVDWEKRYKDLQSEYTKLKQGAAPKENPKEEQKEASKDVSTDPFKKYEQEFIEKGKLSEASYKELKDTHGLSQEAVNEIVEVRKVKAQAVQEEVLSVISENVDEAYTRYGEMVKWAKNAFTKDEAAAFNKLVTSGDPQMMKLGVKNLVDRYTAYRKGEDPTGSLEVGNTVGTAVNTFKDMDELRQALRDPRMGKSESYTKEVQSRIPKSWG